MLVIIYYNLKEQWVSQDEYTVGAEYMYVKSFCADEKCEKIQWVIYHHIK